MTFNNIPTDTKEREMFRTPLAPRHGAKAFWTDAWQNKKYLLFCFFVPALVTLLTYICFSVWPVGDGSVLVLDLNGQYVYFFEGLRDIIYGDGSLLYSFSRSLGGEFMGIFAYYLSSPFSFIVALFPKEYITEALLFMFVLKAGACGLTFGIYIETTRKRRRVATVIFSTMYSLCGYAVVMQHNTMWTDNLIFLPLVLLGIENIIRYGKYRLFIITLSLAIFSNFYIGYMTCIFVFIYYFYYYFSRTDEERNPRGEKFHFLKSSGRMALFSIITIAICSAILLCTYYSLTLGKTTFSNPNYALEQKFDWLDLIPKFFIGSYDTVRPEGLPFVYCGTLTLILMPLYFFAPHIRVREKIASGIVILIFLASFNVSLIDLFWHGLQRPNWLNYRYSFIFCFFLILLAYKAFEKFSAIGYRKAVSVSAFLGILLLIIQKQEYENVDDFSTIWLSMGIIAGYLGLLRAAVAKERHARLAASLILAVLVTTEMFGGALLNMNSLGYDVVYSTRSSYRTFVDGLLPVVNNVKEADDSFYRMEKNHHRKTNDNFALDMNGLSNSTSTLNSETIKLLNSYGISSKSHWSKYLGGTPVSDTLFGIKYVIGQDSKGEIFELYEETEYGDSDYTVWKNPYAMSIAAGVNERIAELDTDEYESAFQLMNATVSAMLGLDETAEIFRSANVLTPGCESLQKSNVASHVKYAPVSGATSGRLTFSIEIDSEDTLYLFIPSDYPRECYLYINGLKNGSYFGNETDRIVEIGSFDVGETVTVTLETIEDGVYLKQDHDYFCYLDSEAFEKYAPSLSDSAFIIDKYTDDRFDGTITVQEGDEYIYTSIPYDKGWKVYCDGKAIETEKILSGLIGFSLSEGTHDLTLKYRPDCLYLGSAVSAAGVLSFAAIWFFDEYFRRKRVQAGAIVYNPIDRGDEKYDHLLVLPDQSVFHDDSEQEDQLTVNVCHTFADGGFGFSAPEENTDSETEENSISADAENDIEGDENI